MAELDITAQFWKNRNHWLYCLARDKKLSDCSVRVGLLFGTFFSPSRLSLHPGYEWIMENGRIGSRHTVSKALRELQEQGYLLVEKGFHQNHRYYPTFDCDGDWQKS
jgi:hypothetical protein